MMVGLCERFHCLPSQLAREDTGFIRMLKIIAAARPDLEEPDA
jgi:hypothetical protein